MKLYKSELRFSEVFENSVTICFWRWEKDHWHPLLMPIQMNMCNFSKEELSDIVGRAHDDQVRLFEFVSDLGMI